MNASDINIWLVATILLLPPLGLALFVAMRSDCDNRLVAVQISSGLSVLALAAMSFAFDQPSFIDLALCLTLLSVPGTYLFALFMERWL